MQNILLAARALGLGATLTTLCLQFEKQVEAALGLLPIGYPMGRLGSICRVPLIDAFFQAIDLVHRWRFALLYVSNEKASRAGFIHREYEDNPTVEMTSYPP